MEVRFIKARRAICTLINCNCIFLRFDDRCLEELFLIIAKTELVASARGGRGIYESRRFSLPSSKEQRKAFFFGKLDLGYSQYMDISALFSLTSDVQSPFCCYRGLENRSLDIVM